MKRSRSSAFAIAVSFRPLVARTGVIVLLSAALGLIIVSHSHNSTVQAARSALYDAVSPVIGVLAKPADTISGVSHWMSDMATLKDDNLRLKEENTRLLKWQTVATQLSSENDKLRALLKFAPASKSAYTSARVVADTGSPYSRSVIITSGKNQGVQEDLAVVNETGLVGRVIDVAKKTSRVLLLTDMNSRIPVVSEDSHERAIAGGNNSDTLSLIYLPENSKLAIGEKIVTSGDGGVLPPGLPVGVVTKIEKGVATVKPFADSYRLDYVTVVDFGM